MSNKFITLQWRKFNFFDLKQEADNGVISQALKAIKIIFNYV